MKDPVTIPMDLPSIDPQAPDSSLQNLRWPTEYTTYNSLTGAIVDNLLNHAKDLYLLERESALLRSKTYDIVTDLAFIGRLGLDICNARRVDTPIVYASNSSPLLTFLVCGGDPLKLSIPRVWHHPTGTSLIGKTIKTMRQLRSLSHAIFAGPNRVDVLNHNNLVDNLLVTKKLRFADWPATNYNWPVGLSLPRNMTDVAHVQTTAFVKSIQSFIDDKTILAYMETLGRHLINFHLAKAAADLGAAEYFLRCRPLGKTLVSGTPKHLGRLIGWLYHRLGKQVIRCAHGGERAFFDDYEWGLAEFTECDVYYAHSLGEATAIRNRLSRGGTAVTNPENKIDVRTLGSSHHLNILKSSVVSQQRNLNNKIAYIAGGYLGEQLGDFPSRKPPDTLYLDWQIHLIQSLRRLGVEVIVKIHPAGVGKSSDFLSPYADHVVEGLFDPLQWDVDCFIFDFAGTAFFDALSTQTPVVLADMTVRPFDQSTKEDLAVRCEIMACFIDERGRFRVTPSALANSLEAARSISEIPKEFYDRYLDA